MGIPYQGCHGPYGMAIQETNIRPKCFMRLKLFAGASTAPVFLPLPFRLFPRIFLTLPQLLTSLMRLLLTTAGESWRFFTLPEKELA